MTTTQAQTQLPTWREAAADMAAVASLLEMADRLGVLHVIRRNGGFQTADLVREAGISEAGATGYLEAMTNASLVLPDGGGTRQIRLASSYAAPDDIERGVTRLARFVNTGPPWSR